HVVCSASTVDQMPKQVSSGLMFGTALSVPVPDLDRTDHLVVLGGNPMVSNGSLMTAPDVKSRLRAIRERGGRIVVVDPRRTRTSEEADEHVFVRPGTDALLLAGMAHAILAEGLARPGRLAEHLAGLDEVERALADFAPEAVEGACGVPAATIRRLARELAAAPSAAVYGRIGTCTQEFGSLASWLVDVLNVLTGNLDRPGGAMFPRSATGPAKKQGEPGRGKGIRLGRWKSRVRGAPEAFGEIPAACLAEEIETPGDGQLRVLFTVAGNPALSTPNGGRLSRALASLGLMVSLDIYLNETTRHAHVIFPGLSGLEQPHFPFAFTSLAVRNFARYSRPAIEPPPGAMPEWRTLLRLAAIASGQGAAVDTDVLDDFLFEQQLGRSIGSAHSPIHGRDAAEIRAATSSVRGPERLLDLAIRTGPWGDGYGARPGGLSIAKLLESPHGVDLGPLEPRIPEVLRTPSGRIELAPEPLVADLARLRDRLSESGAGGPTMVLVGRRDLRSNNSWMHNVESLVSGRPRCTLHLHPDDARRIGVADGGSARVRSRAGEVVASVELTDGIMPGVASLPHGWGHDEEGSRLSVARAHAGVNSNRLAEEAAIDPLSGNTSLNDIPVEIAPA
ncbi:MAG: molybdopterin dinucleotide binding domain-containing protein, partial [Alphaproteobacteria bacterium]